MEKYQIQFVMTITKAGSKEPMSVTNQTYNNLEYVDVVNIEKALTGALVALGETAVQLKKKD